jgi:hypothetical protein
MVSLEVIARGAFVYGEGVLVSIELPTLQLFLLYLAKLNFRKQVLIKIKQI